MNIEIRDVLYSYPVRNGSSKPALNGVTLGITSGECVGIIGPEGSGKSTLLLLLKGLLQSERGSIHVGETNVLTRGSAGKALRAKIGLSFQFPAEQFLSQTVREEIRFGMHDRSDDRLAECLTETGLDPDRYLDRSPFHLSMGEARRIVLASLLMRRPDVLLLDEPTVGLDGDGLSVLTRILRRESERGVTILLVSHDLDFLAEHATKMFGLADGRVVIEGPLARVVSNPEGLNAVGYELPEITRIHEQLWDSGQVPRGEFLRSRELRAFLRRLKPKGKG
ncbi:MAG: energy-coupling factor ABC transporter ATP-binding protein [Ignavibacteria bacterium]|nr:energy-coupling factor ABC transporter ATP-binding protein [Ignavibacteria bacterium]